MRREPTLASSREPEAALEALALRWADAELRGDVALLDDLLASGFVGITTRGALLTRADWIGRHASHALEHTEFSWDEPHVQAFGSVAVLTGIQRVRGIVAGNVFGGRIRGMLVIVRTGDHWRIVAVQQTPLLDPGESDRQRRGAD